MLGYFLGEASELAFERDMSVQRSSSINSIESLVFGRAPFGSRGVP